MTELHDRPRRGDPRSGKWPLGGTWSPSTWISPRTTDGDVAGALRPPGRRTEGGGRWTSSRCASWFGHARHRFNLILFPNVSMSISFLRVLRPDLGRRDLIEHIALGPDGPAEIVGPVNRERLRIHEHFQGPFGFGTPDDAEGWDRVQRGASGGSGDADHGQPRPGPRRPEPPRDGPPRTSPTRPVCASAYDKWKEMMSDD